MDFIHLYDTYSYTASCIIMYMYFYMTGDMYMTVAKRIINVLCTFAVDTVPVVKYKLYCNVPMCIIHVHVLYTTRIYQS